MLSPSHPTTLLVTVLLHLTASTITNRCSVHVCVLFFPCNSHARLFVCIRPYTWCIYCTCLAFPLFLCFWLVRPSAIWVNKSYVNVNVKGSISAADRKRNNQGFFYSSIINEDWRLIYRLITRLYREWCTDTRMEGRKKGEWKEFGFAQKLNRRNKRERRGRQTLVTSSSIISIKRCFSTNVDM